MANTTYNRFRAFTQAFFTSHQSQDVLGDSYDLPDTIVYRQATHPIPGGGRIEVNRITPQTPPGFAWETEITINHKSAGDFIHLILQRDQEVVETYGKTILPIDDPRATEILTILTELTET
jgi:hypothetical protein